MFNTGDRSDDLLLKECLDRAFREISNNGHVTNFFGFDDGCDEVIITDDVDEAIYCIGGYDELFERVKDDIANEILTNHTSQMHGESYDESMHAAAREEVARNHFDELGLEPADLDTWLDGSAHIPKLDDDYEIDIEIAKTEHARKFEDAIQALLKGELASSGLEGVDLTTFESMFYPSELIRSENVFSIHRHRVSGAMSEQFAESGILLPSDFCTFGDEGDVVCKHEVSYANERIYDLIVKIANDDSFTMTMERLAERDAIVPAMDAYLGKNIPLDDLLVGLSV